MNIKDKEHYNVKLMHDDLKIADFKTYDSVEILANTLFPSATKVNTITDEKNKTIIVYSMECPMYLVVGVV